MINKSSFRFLWIGQSIANCGDVFYIVAIIATIYATTGSVTYMAMFPFVNTLARFLSGMIAPLLLDRFNLKVLLVYSQFGKTIILALLAIFSFFTITASMVFVVLIFVILISFLDGWASPARDTLIPQLLHGNDLLKANSFLSTLDQIIQLGAWPIGGILIVAIGSSNLIWFTVALFTISTIMMALINHSNNSKDEDGSIGESATITKWNTLKEGWVTIWNIPSLRTISIIEFIESIANVVWIAAIMYVYVDQVLHTSERWWGYINSSLSAGLIIGGFIGLKWSNSIEKKLTSIVVLGAFLVSVATFLFGITTTPWLALVFPMIFGISSVIKGIAQQTIIQTTVSSRRLSKVYAAQDTIIFGTFGVSTLLMGYLTDLFGARFIFLLASSFLFLTAIFVTINQEKLGVTKLEKKDANMSNQ
ncbi:MFS transporter [Priestia aryabhattai]|uniref:MFS transporter n=1 Tax=Priestia aryabhattai TaxID=412384 RepID=UPI002E1A8E9C|nr:MFS transporter [Priestia aryabhattai]